MTRLVSCFIVSLSLLIISQTTVLLVSASFGFDSQAIRDSYLRNPAGNPPSELIFTPPTYIPPVSTGDFITNFDDGQVLTNQSIVSTFGSEPNVDLAQGVQTGAHLYSRNQIKLWTYSSGWTQSLTSIAFNTKANMIFYTQQRQRTWIYEYYPNGNPIRSYLGYRGSGYVYLKFFGDTPGMHQIIIYGERSGWSNVLQIYVWDVPEFAWECFYNCMGELTTTGPIYDPRTQVFDLGEALKEKLIGPCFTSCVGCSTGITSIADCPVCDFCLSYYLGYTIGYSGICAVECFKNRYSGGYGGVDVNERPSSCSSCSS